MFSRLARPLAAAASSLAFGAAVAAVCAAPASAAAPPALYHFGFTGGMQSWVVPDGITSIRVDLFGAGGGEPFSDGFPPSYGARASTDYLEVTPGATLHVTVGGKGGQRGNNVSGAGYNGGGAGTRFGGGGATDIRTGGTALTNRVLVAGGGGGSGSYGGDKGGDGGGLVGGSGGGGFGGAGGTQTAGGLGTYPTWGGSFGVGGPGPNAGPNVTGGGGGGWYGGAGGPGGGGGGSGYGTGRTTFWPGATRDNGHATIAIGPQTGRYSGRTQHTTPISFDLDSHYELVTSFRWNDRIYFEKASFLQDGKNGSFSHWTASDMHFYGHWLNGFVTGGISYPAGGARTTVTWTAYR